ncbi:hypothetical protein GOP47_0018334 [Adiantum capillus-veneris]|uniref:Uncharacterized protein n=1 Tax=Adiantum capillus-veneris TaxID=13818 RepID=A0A9D4UH43_ADICA|nr:hypothetical protein GOP47_0018334 [Adiantum capillus-veneris]
MDSLSPASPPFSRTPSRKDDDDIDIDDSSVLLFQWVHSIKPLYKALSIVIVSSIFAALVFSSLPLWRPVGVLMLHKLWDILRFLVITTSIGLGIINSKLWRDNRTDRDNTAHSPSSDGGKEDSVSSRVPFVGMFYSEFQPSLDDKEPDIGEGGFTKAGSGKEKAGGANMTASATAMAMEPAYHEENKATSEDITETTDSSFPSANMSSKLVSETEDGEHDARVVEELSMSPPSVNNNMKVASTKGKLKLPQAIDDLSLGTRLGSEQPKHGGKVAHRRGSSLEFPMQQEGVVGKPRDVHLHHHKHVDAAEEKFSSSHKTSYSASKASDRVKRQSNVSANAKTSVNSVSASTSTSGASRHSRSRSAYDLNELLVNENRPRSKPGPSGQLGRRRNVSLSCDLDKEFSLGGAPTWLAELPPPPVPPPLLEGYEIDASEGVLPSEQDESSLRKAYTESLAPWRVATIETPVNKPHKEEPENGKENLSRKEEKKASSKENTVTLGPSPPSPPSSFMGSPGPAELNKKVDAFIARFHERMRLQRLESLKRSRQTAH